MKIEFDLDLEEIKNELLKFITDKCINDLVYKIAVEIAETIEIDLENSEEFKKEFHKTILDYMYNNMYCDFEDKIEEFTKNMFKKDFVNIKGKTKIEILEELLNKEKGVKND